ncbi:MAG: sigma 54-interacting transcriptional regulator [Deltaproteobacteria bacterium]|nr:sigma 54-interacting transcriptional regulator [Deltaproteobacteria bacterium]
MQPGPSDDVLALAVFAGDSVTVYPLPRGGRLTIGRSEENDVAIPDASVSRAHAIVHVGATLEIEDLGGANATMLSPASARSLSAETLAMRRVSKRRAELAVGDVLSFGTVVAVVRRADPPTEAALATADDDVVANHPSTRAVYDQAARAARGLLSVLILGETGVGKDVLARFVHRRSPRADGPFLPLNCAALSESLLEAELFGHEKGAFTGAVGARAGLLESADGGTVFLDEIGDLPMPIQIKLLRVLEQREVMRIGARTPKRIDVRFVAATNRDLDAACASGAFREDLFFRLNGISLVIPPLRERPSEIPELAARFLASACRQMDRARPPQIGPQALAKLEAYAWPGNARELRNVIDRAVTLADTTIGIEHLPPKIAAATLGASRPPVAPAPPTEMAAAVAPVSPAAAAPTTPTSLEQLRRAMEDAERQRIVDALAACGGNQTRAAEMLGISRRTLVNRLDEYDLSRPRKR